jgi:hypothetical protein
MAAAVVISPSRLWCAWCQEPPSLKLRDADAVLHATSLTAMLESFWQTDAAFQQLRSKIMWAYIAVVESGVFRTFPAHEMSSSYDPYVWHTRAPVDALPDALDCRRR